MSKRPLDYEARISAPASAHRKPLVLGALVLFIYPFCIAANVMSLAASDAPARPVYSLARMAWRGFLWGSTVYPLIYLAAAGISVFFASNDRPTAAWRIAISPLIYLGVLLLCFMVAQAAGV